jgi:uncharacterized membrane protein
MNDPRTWFGPKRFGIGWSPRTWEGWALIGAVVLAALLLKFLL